MTIENWQMLHAGKLTEQYGVLTHIILALIFHIK